MLIVLCGRGLIPDRLTRFGMRRLMAALTATCGHAEARRWFQRWRMFFMAVAELFGYADGTEWLVGHCRFGR
jgi:cyclopropane-fatty-acyl-phospholipid synthase